MVLSHGDLSGINRANEFIFYAFYTVAVSEMEMDQWVMGQMGHLRFWMGHMGQESLYQ